MPRLVITVLRNAARTAMHEQSERITPAIVEEMIPHAHSKIHRKNPETLTPHQRELYDIINEQTEVVPSDLYEAYRERVESPKSDRTVRTYLSKMDRYGLIDIEGTSRDRSFRGITGRTCNFLSISIEPSEWISGGPERTGRIEPFVAVGSEGAKPF